MFYFMNDKKYVQKIKFDFWPIHMPMMCSLYSLYSIYIGTYERYFSFLDLKL